MSSLWEIEYRGTLADSAPGGDKRTLAAWGLSGISELTMLNLARGNMVLAVDGTTSFLADLPWAYRDKIVLWRDGARYWHGWLTSVPRGATPEADAITLTFADPWWWLEIPMSDPVMTNIVIGPVTFENDFYGPVTITAAVSVDWVEPSGTITWGFRDQSRYTVQGQIRRAVYAAIRAGAPIAIGAIGIDAAAATQESRGSTALSYLQAAVQFEPLSVGWWDPSGATPVIHVQPRSAITPATYALATDAPTGIQCTPLSEMQALAVRIRWAYTASDGQEVDHIERAGDDSLPLGHNVMLLEAEVDDLAGLIEVLHYNIAGRLYASLGPMAYSGSLSLSEDLDALDNVLPGIAINITGGRTEWATMAGIVQQVTISVMPEADTLTCTWGAPSHLGLSDWLALRDLGNSAVDHAGYDPGRGTITPGTVGELNGTDPFASNPSGTISTQIRGGQWQAQGFPPNPYVSAPALPLYRTATISGSAVTAIETTNPNTTVSHSGVATVDDAGAVTAGITRGWTDDASGSGGPESVSRLQSYGPGSISKQWYAFSQSPTLRKLKLRQWRGSEWDGVPCLPSSEDNGVTSWEPSTGNTVTASGEQIETLSSPDGESEATARLLAASDWAYADETTTAIRTVPSSVTSGKYRELRIGTYAAGVYTPLEGQIAWQRYRLAIATQWRTVDQSGTPTGEWVDADTVYSTPWITDMTGAGGCQWYTIEPMPGLETRIVSATPELF